MKFVQENVRNYHLLLSHAENVLYKFDNLLFTLRSKGATHQTGTITSDDSGGMQSGQSLAAPVCLDRSENI